VDDRVFREYDIRGKVGSELYLHEIYALGQAIAYYFLTQKPDLKTVAIGRDARLHSQVIQDELARAMVKSGLNVIFMGICPTPVLYFALHTLPVDAGLMVTASHNGKEFNGIKICLGKESLWGHHIQKIREFFRSRVSYSSVLPGTKQSYPMVDRYITWMVKKFQHLKNFDQPCIIDCSNGPTAVVMPEIVSQLQWQNVRFLYDHLDGEFPNHEPDPVIAENMKTLKLLLATTDARFGIGFDGDGDRMAPMTKKGEIVGGDRLIVLFGSDIVAHVPQASIVYDIKCSAFVQKFLTDVGARAYVSPSGHSIIKKEMVLHNALFGGELSCHFFFNDRYFGYDDGIYAALRLCELIAKNNNSLEDISALFTPLFSTPEIRILCARTTGTKVIEEAEQFFSDHKEATVCTIDGVKAVTPYGWGLIRCSNTQEMVSMRFESATQEGLNRIKQDFYAVLKNHLDPKVFPPAFLE